MRKLLRPLSMLLVLAMLATTATFSVLSATNDYNSSGADIEVEATSAYTNSGESYNTYSGTDLGAVYSKDSTTFKVWAPSASKVQLKLYNTGSDSETGAGVIGTYDMSKDSSNGVWSITQSGDLNGMYYTYLVTVNGTTKETRDVYANADGVNGKRSMVVDLDSTDPEGWSNDTHVLFDNAPEAAVWEVSVRDFSIDSTSGVDADKRGKYMAFTQHGTTLNGAGVLKTGIDYLIENNINCVQIMPMYDFGSVDETKGGQNWGYDPVNYNVPEGSFSSDPYNGEVRIKELKSMIKALHDAGISVIMDVVYNHTYNTSDSAFENTVPGYYYRMNGSTFLNGSGCGNVTASDKTMYRKYMIDSVKYWANEYHIDGFRFDLMGCHDYTTMNNIRAELDKIDKRIITYGEPWMADWGANGIDSSSAAVMDNASKLNPRVGCFNDKMRNALKGGTSDKSSGFIQGSTSSTADVKAGCMAHTSSILGKWSQAPSQTVTYNSCHDNLTLWDKILYSQGSTDYNGSNGTFLAMNKLSAALVLTSQGVAFTQAGEEFARTKRGDENSYNTGDAVNKIDWTRISQYSSLREYYKGLRLIRQVYSPFTDASNTSVGQSYFTGSNSVIAYTMQNKTANAANEWGTVAVIANNSASTQSVTLKASTTLPTSWATIVNGSSAGLKNLGTVTGTTISVPARTAMVLVDLVSFNEKNIQGPTTPTTTTPSSGTVTWNTTKIKGFADGVSSEVIDGATSQITKIVEPEDGYEIVYAKVVSGGTDITSTAYNATTNTINFTRNGNAEITLIATQIPQTHLYGDVNEDGNVNVRDVTAIQKYICYLDDSLSEVGKKAANVNGDDGIDISDATLIQKYATKAISSMPVGESFSDEKPTYTIPTNPTNTTSSTTATVPTSTQTSPTNPSGSITINFVSTIDTGEERWAAYCWTGANSLWVDVVNGQVTVPSSMENIIFVRFDGTSTENKWDEEGATVKYVWNQTDDLFLGLGSTYTVTGWGDGWGALLEGSWS